MKKTKIKQRFENAFDAFFDNEKLDEEFLLTSSSDSTVTHNRFAEILSAKGDVLVKVLKRMFLFFPGAFILFYISMATVFLVVDISTKDITIPPNVIRDIFWVYLVGFVSIFAVWFGLGNWRKLNHFAIPGSIIFAGVFLGVVIRSTEQLFTLSEKLIHDFHYAIYLFPTALIIPFLAKGFVDKTSDEKFDG